ncbi:MAG: LysM peptidoglycan-binding domain-containing protein [Rhabdochlamydiaceae bacterium]
MLEKIARLNHVTVDEIMQANKMSNTRLKIGQVLKIPTKSKKTQATSSNPAEASHVKYYTIKNGDNLWAIAVKNHMKMEDLLKLNNLTEEKARRLKAGDQIRIHE